MMIVMSNAGRSIAAASALVLSSVAARAGTFYVSPTGSNSNLGTADNAAWQTLQFAANHVGPGDTVNVTVYRGGKKMDIPVKLGERDGN
jgi:archaellum component FlaF (FlaF/FlaG flagellin family)